MSFRQFRKAVSVHSRRRHVPGTMNATEQDYALHLDMQKFDGEILDWAFEPITLRLAPKVSYTPDFLVQKKDGTIELHEVKACRKGGQYLSEDDAWVKLKIADSMFNSLFRFARAGKFHKSDGGGWRFDYLRPNA